MEHLLNNRLEIERIPLPIAPRIIAPRIIVPHRPLPIVPRIIGINAPPVIAPPGIFQIPLVEVEQEQILNQRKYIVKPRSIPRQDRGVLNVPHKNAKTFDSIIELLSINMDTYDRISTNTLIENANITIVLQHLNLKVCSIINSFVIVALYKEMTMNIGNNYDMKHRMFHYNRLYNAYTIISGKIKKFVNLDERLKAESIWNINANIINMELLSTKNWKIPICKKKSESFHTIIHTIGLDGNDISLNVKSYKMYVGPIFSRLTGEPNEENNSLFILFEPIFQDILNGVSMKETMIKYPHQYGLAMNARKNLIRLHGTSCTINPNESNFFLERLNFEFKANRPINPIHDKIVSFGQKKNKAPRFMVPSFTRTARCPCIQNIDKRHPITGIMTETVICCNRVFNLGDMNTREEILKTFDPNNTSLGDIQENYKKLLFWFSPNLKNKARITPKCPFCMTEFDNIEGENNYYGREPISRHPTDVTCPSCNKDFCTDCKEQHPGELCNGMVRLPDGSFDWIHQSCPGCATIIDRIDGCSFIKCKALPIIDGEERLCGTEWCWICRCIRLPEFNGETHYCLINDDYTNTNPNYKPRWTNNNKWIEDSNTWREQTKMKPLNREAVIGNTLVV